MKNFYFPFLLAFVYSSAIGQFNFPCNFSESVLLTETSAYANGMGEIGVVTPTQNANFHFAQNPANAYHEKEENLGMELGYRNSSCERFFLEGLIGYRIDDRHGLALLLRERTDMEFIVNPSGFTEKSQQPFIVLGELNYAFRIGNGFSLGASVGYVESHLTEVAGGSSEPWGPSSEWIGGFGASFQNQWKLGNKGRTMLQLSCSFDNLGEVGSTRYDLSTGVEERYLPAIMRMGVMEGFRFFEKSSTSFAVNFAYQIDKLMVPTREGQDEDGNGKRDYYELKAIESYIYSFSDSPDGRKGEIRELTHRVGLDTWLYFLDGYGVGLRAGYVKGQFQKQRTYGISFKTAMNLQLNAAYTHVEHHVAHALFNRDLRYNRFSISLSYVHHIDKRT